MEALFESMALYATAVRFAVEFTKAGLVDPIFNTLGDTSVEITARRAVILMLSAFYAFLLVFGSGESMNIAEFFPGFKDSVDPVFGKIVTTLIVAGGSNVVQEIVKFIGTLNRRNQPELQKVS